MTRILTAMRAPSWINYAERQLTAKPRRDRAQADAEPARPKQPERRLLVELLHGAVIDLTTTKREDAATLRAAAREWIAGAAAPITFATVCELLEIDTDAARAALLDEQHPQRDAVLFEIGALASAA